MTKLNLIGNWIRRFLMEHLIGERNLAHNTQSSYRDTLSLLLPFVAIRAEKPVDRLCVEHFSADNIRLFLRHLEQERTCSVATRNQRLAAIHALSRFIGERSPEHISWSTEIRSIPFKKTAKPSLPYLEKPEMDALLKAPDRQSEQGQRDYALLLFLYNTGARADEASRLIIADLNLSRSASVKIIGKGGKVRFCPLWSLTVEVLSPLITSRAPTEAIFLNSRCTQNKPITRFGICALVKRYVLKAGQQEHSLCAKKISTHTIRHTTAVHLLCSGVDINTIRGWLGHVSLNTTNVYAEVNLEMKVKALAHCEITGSGQHAAQWHSNSEVMTFLRAL